MALAEGRGLAASTCDDKLKGKVLATDGPARRVRIRTSTSKLCYRSHRCLFAVNFMNPGGQNASLCVDAGAKAHTDWIVRKMVGE